jgi:hypothetical protein
MQAFPPVAHHPLRPAVTRDVPLALAAAATAQELCVEYGNSVWNMCGDVGCGAIAGNTNLRFAGTFRDGSDGLERATSGVTIGRPGLPLIAVSRH